MSMRARLLDTVRADVSRWGAPADQVGGIDALAERLGRPLDVAVVRFDGIGDWVLTIPLVTALEESPSVRSVTLVAPPAVAGLLTSHSGPAVQPVDLNTTFAPKTFDRRLGKLLAVSRSGQRAALRDGRRSRGRFDLAVLPRWQVDRGYNARPWALGTGAVLAGHDPASQPLTGAKERREIRLLALHPFDTRPVAHEMERLLALTAALGLPARAPVGYGRPFFGLPAERHLAQGRHVMIHTGASEAKRVWPTDRWRATVAALLTDDSTRVTLIGAPSERAEHLSTLEGLGDRATTSAGAHPFSRLPSALDTADVFIGADSGPAHIASALGVPSVVLTCHPLGADPAHANSPDRFGPWASPGTVLRPPSGGAECTDRCSHTDAHCILGIEVAAVVDAVDRRVAPGARAGTPSETHTQRTSAPARSAAFR